MKKDKLFKKALSLREEGLSLKEISEKLNISKSTASSWLKETAHKERKMCYESRKKTYLNTRKQYQEEGRIAAKKLDPLHIQGCMLYWGEGEKSVNSLGFSNTDSNMIKTFLSFLRKYFPEENIILRIVAYTDILSQEEIEAYWLKETDLSKGSLRTGSYNTSPTSSSGKKKGKHPYGCCALKIHSTKAVQHIFGAIQEYANFENKNWISKE
jgi:hypothetical protein